MKRINKEILCQWRNTGLQRLLSEKGATQQIINIPLARANNSRGLLSYVNKFAVMFHERITRISNRPRQLPSAGTTKISAHDLHGRHFSSRVNAARSLRINARVSPMEINCSPSTDRNYKPIAGMVYNFFFFFFLLSRPAAHVKTAFKGTRYGPVRVNEPPRLK